MKNTIRYFISFYKPYKKIFFTDLLCASMISIIDIAYPLIFSACVSVLFVQSPAAILNSLWWVSGGLILMYAVKMVCRYYVTCQGHIMGAMMERDMRQNLFEQYQKLSFSYYDTHNTGTMMSKVISDLFDISELAHHGPENLFISILKLAGSFLIMFLLNWQLSLCLLCTTVFMLLFLYRQNGQMRATFMDNRKKIAEINSSLQDSLAGIKVVQSFANEPIEQKKFDRSNNRFLESKKRNYKAMGTYYSGSAFLTGMLYVTVIAAGGLFIANGSLKPEELAAFALYVNVFVGPLEILIEFTEMFQKGFSGFQRFEEIMVQIPDIQDEANAVDLIDVKGDIALEHVSFAYEDGQPVLEDVSLNIPAGRNVALVGPSGAGKSTICSLIPRFYDVKSGRVLVDGKDVKDLTLKSLRSSIGIVQQDVYLFDGTIAENIRYGKPDASDEEVLEAARKANLMDFISTLPDGIHTLTGERGTRLSGGQKQRISIARIFLKDPKILILDEATSALDNESESVVQESLYELSKGRTCLTIAHRLSTIKNADEIVVISENGIEEQGSHDQLMAHDGTYKKYYQLQFQNQQ